MWFCSINLDFQARCRQCRKALLCGLSLLRALVSACYLLQRRPARCTENAVQGWKVGIPSLSRLNLVLPAECPNRAANSLSGMVPSNAISALVQRRCKANFLGRTILRRRSSTLTRVRPIRLATSSSDSLPTSFNSRWVHGRKRRKGLLANPLDVSQAQRERLAFLELRAFFTGELRRGDIEARFGIKPAAASRDLSLYRKIAPFVLAARMMGSRSWRSVGQVTPRAEIARRGDRLVSGDWPEPFLDRRRLVRRNQGDSSRARSPGVTSCRPQAAAPMKPASLPRLA